jgi:molecular chaperone DnaJ
MDPYKVLGIPRGVGLSEVKRAFRKQVKRFHPDLQSGSSKDVDGFLRLQKAYRALVAELSVTYRSSIAEVYEKDLRVRGKGGADGAFFFLELHAKQAIKGTRIKVSVPDHETFCPECGGLGKVADRGARPCSACSGLGYQEVEWGDEILNVVCNRCSGQGTNNLVPCPGCGGKGQLVAERTIEITIPPGTRDGAVLKVPAQGPWDSAQNRRQALFFEVNVLFPDGFRLIENDIYSRLTIDCWTALAGGPVTVQLLEDSVEVEIAPGTQAGDEIRLKGLGWPDGEDGRGDHVLVLDVAFPDSPCPKEAKGLIERLKRIWPAGLGK